MSYLSSAKKAAALATLFCVGLGAAVGGLASVAAAFTFSPFFILGLPVSLFVGYFLIEVVMDAST